MPISLCSMLTFLGGDDAGIQRGERYMNSEGSSERGEREIWYMNSEGSSERREGDMVHEQ